jgi:poly(A) polymerase/tRNA nucleotidyltransferase (CCA-adding enzyme)
MPAGAEGRIVMNIKSGAKIDLSRLRGNVPQGALEVVTRIAEAGGQAYLVGGCLRDLLLERSPKDWDIATDLQPAQVKPLFRKVHEVGAAFGTLLVPRHDGVYDVTTFRTEGNYTDGRHPDRVAYTSRLLDDLQRRDFTINAMAWDPRTDQIEDPFGGLADLRGGQIRAVGDPLTRFREDALRLMRAVRFAAQLEFHVAQPTWDALRKASAGLRRISPERIRDELNLIMLAPQPSRGLMMLHQAGLLVNILPELEACRGIKQNRFHAHDVFMHSLLSADAAPEGNLTVRLAALLHDIAKPDTREEREGDYTFYAHQVVGARKVDRILRRLRYSNDDRERITHLIYHHMFYYETQWTDSAVRRFARTVGMDNIPDLISLRLADMVGNGRKAGDTSPLQALLRRVDEVIAKDTALSVKDLAIGGHEIMDLGVPKGPGIGRILRALLDKVLEDPASNTAEVLLEAARALIAGGVHLRPDRPEGESDQPSARGD